MFVSHDKNSVKRTFQKPNILRRKTKVTKPKLNVTCASVSATEAPLVRETACEQVQKITKHEATNTPTIIKPMLWKFLDSSNNSKNHIEEPDEIDVDAKISCTTIFRNATQNNNSGPINPEEKSEFIVDVVHSGQAIIPAESEQPNQQQDLSSVVTTSIQTMTVDCLSNRAIKYKCDFPNCNKGFWIEERLKKHKISHNRQTARNAGRILIECPVKNVGEDGTEERCPRTFQVRGELLKHLNADHTPEDALHRCEVCGRRFFWASGLRAHAQSVCARGGLACGWPGCDKTFHLPCRLREHARAHTGDRPYLCQYPECGWAFRSASKLVRHARRHTDERRHACATCGRAFLRREHLRDHDARHHSPRARPTHRCTHLGCEQTFTNMSSLYVHMKRVHRMDKSSASSAAEKSKSTKAADTDYIHNFEKYVVEISEGGEASEVGEADGPDEAAEAGEATEAEEAVEECEAGGAARTHVPWPLPRHTRIIDDIVTVEQAEDSGSNVYTVRSDLFLHSNVPIDEDSQNMGGAGAGDEGAGEGEALVAGLGLHDHPTIDLMQEELIYTDAAVDETSFRLLLMNGEELT